MPPENGARCRHLTVTFSSPKTATAEDFQRYREPQVTSRQGLTWDCSETDKKSQEERTEDAMKKSEDLVSGKGIMGKVTKGFMGADFMAR